jgi:hypothetical protein
MGQPKFKDIVSKLNLVTDSVSLVSQAKEDRDDVSAQSLLELRDYAAKLRDRDRWCKNLLYMVWLGFIFSIGTTIALGLGWLHFENSTVTVPVGIGAGFVETYALAKIAVGFLFDGKKGSSK